MEVLLTGEKLLNKFQQVGPGDRRVGQLWAEVKDFRLTERAIGSLAAGGPQVGGQLPAESKILNPA